MVVLPAPLGPISPWIAPVAISKLTPSTARSPPKLSASSWTDRQVLTCGASGPERARFPGRANARQGVAESTRRRRAWSRVLPLRHFRSEEDGHGHDVGDRAGDGVHGSRRP